VLVDHVSAPAPAHRPPPPVLPPALRSGPRRPEALSCARQMHTGPQRQRRHRAPGHGGDTHALPPPRTHPAHPPPGAPHLRRLPALPRGPCAPPAHLLLPERLLPHPPMARGMHPHYHPLCRPTDPAHRRPHRRPRAGRPPPAHAPPERPL